MKKLGLALSTLVFSMSASAAEYVVKLKDFRGRVLFPSSMNMRVLDQHTDGSLIKVEIPETKKLSTMIQLFQAGTVEYMVPNIQLKAFGTVSSTELATQGLRDQWALKKINAEQAWKLAGNKGDKKIVVAVIDTGVDYNHESLKVNSVPGIDYRDNDSDPMDLTSAQNPGHGTHCAGIVGATGDVENGVAGMATNVAIMPIRFLGADGSGDLMNGIKSIDYAIKNGAHIISASWGAAVPRSQAKPLIEAVQRASDAGVIMIMAAANDGKSNDKVDMFPANAEFDNTITVAASNPNDGKPSWSNYGKYSVHLASPGENIMSTLPKNKYGNLSGTSMATPLVSGLAAFLKAQDPTLTGAQIRAIMQATGAQVQIETACNCRIDAAAAVEAVLQKKPIVVPFNAAILLNEEKQFNLLNGNGNLQFASTNPAAATIDANGKLKAVAEGQTQIEITDASGKKVSSGIIHIIKARNSGGGGDDGGDGGDGGECPVGNPALCKILCGIMPDLPFCKQ